MKNKIKKTLLIILPIVIAVMMAIMFSLPSNFEKGEIEQTDNFATADTGAGTAPVSDKGGVLFLEQGATYRMNGGTFTGKNKKYGGAVFVSSGATFEMSGGTITGNSATYGGGIYVQSGGTCKITGGSITSNTANYGPAIYIEEGGTFELGSGATVDNNEVYDESSQTKIEISDEEETMGGTYSGTPSTLKFRTVTFGTYPQTYVGDELNSTLESWYVGKPVVKNYTTRVSGRYGTYDSYEYIDGNIYARGISYRNTSGNTYKDGASVPSDGTPVWFKVEPIKWYIMNYEKWQAGQENIELFSEIALAGFVRFNPSTSDGNNWKNSELQKWCNGKFLNSAFSDAEREMIALTENLNCVTGEYSKSPTTWTGAKTNDYVYCKTYYEMKSSPFSTSSSAGNGNAARLCSPSDFALSNYCYMSSYYTTGYRTGTTYWRLRSAGSSASYACSINNIGNLYDGVNVSHATGGVRPALHLNIKP